MIVADPTTDYVQLDVNAGIAQHPLPFLHRYAPGGWPTRPPPLPTSP